MHLTLPLLHPPLQARGGGEAPGCDGEAGISMQVGWGRPPPRVVHVVGRRVGRVLCVIALWCTGTGAHWPGLLHPPSPRWRRWSPQLTTQAGDVDMTAGARVARVVGRWYDRLGTARHGTARHELGCRAALHPPHHGIPALGTLQRHATTVISARPTNSKTSHRPLSLSLSRARLALMCCALYARYALYYWAMRPVNTRTHPDAGAQQKATGGGSRWH